MGTGDEAAVVEPLQNLQPTQVFQLRGARVLERCDISRSVYGISSSPRRAPNVENCDIYQGQYTASQTPLFQPNLN